VGLYSHYDGARTHPVNRALHMIAIPVGLSSLVWFWFHHVDCRGGGDSIGVRAGLAGPPDRGE